IESGLQTGMSLTSSGAFSWTPTEVQDGFFKVKFRVTDEGGLFDEKTVNITVNELNQNPVIDSITPAAPPSINEGEMLTFTVAAHDDDVGAGVPDGLHYSLSGAPAGASINASTGAFTWATVETDDGTYSFDVVVTDDHGGSTSQTISFTVTEVNQDPAIDSIL